MSNIDMSVKRWREGKGAHRALAAAPGPNSVRSLEITFIHCGFFADINLQELFDLLAS